MSDLVERLRSADMNSQQRALGSPIFGEAAAEITRLRAALADAQAVGFAAGVEAAAKSVKRHSDIARGKMSACYDQHDANSLREWSAIVSHLDIERDAIRALTPPDATAAADRVLLGVWPTDASFDAAFQACYASYHGNGQMQDIEDRTRATVSAALRAIAGDTP